MPIAIFIKGGLSVRIQGENPKRDILRPGLFRKMAHAVAENGHLIEFSWRDRLFLDLQSEAEFQHLKAEAEKKAADEKVQASQEKARGEALRTDALKKASDEFVEKYGPDPANWPEALRPKPPVN